jgi:hypothetical protein
MTVRQLVEHFDPEESTSEVGKRLSRMVGKSPCIVFEKPGSRTVDVDATYGLINEIKGGFPPRQTAKGEVWAIVDVRGTMKPAYPIGFLPDNFAEENPLYPGRPLRPDGTCDQTQRSWTGVVIKIRQFLRVGLGDEIKISRLEDAHNLLDIALQTDALMKLQQRYPQTKIKFEQLEARNKLPDLQIALSSTKEIAKKPAKSPFEQGVQVQWASVPGENYYQTFGGNNWRWK